MRPRNALIGIVTAVLLVVGIGAPAMADTRDDIISTDETLGLAFENAIDVFNSSTSTTEELSEAMNGLAAQAEQAADAYRGHAAAAGDAATSEFAERLAAASDDMADAAAGIVTAIDAGDESGFGTSVDALNDASEDYATAVDEFNRYLADNPIASGDPMYALWFVLLIVSIVFLAGSIAILVLGRKQHGALAATTDRKGKTRQATLSGMRWSLFGLAALFVVGAAIPFVQYWFIAHDGGGEYRVFWYPLALGGVGTVVVAIRYFVAAAKVRREGSAVPLAEAAMAQVQPGQPPMPAPPAPPGGFGAMPPAPAGDPASPGPQTMLNGQPLPPPGPPR